MALDLDKMSKKFDDILENMTNEELEEYFSEDNTPKGWVSIEDHLPMMYAQNIGKGCSEYKVKFKDGTEDITCVSDHNVWYVMAKEAGVTHWWNE